MFMLMLGEAMRVPPPAALCAHPLATRSATGKCGDGSPVEASINARFLRVASAMAWKLIRALTDAADTDEKRAVGALWEKASG